MSKKGKVKMGLGDFLGRDAAAAAQPIKGKILPSGPDPNRDPDERRGSGGRRYDDDYDGHGGRSEGTDNWRRSGPGGGSGSGMDDRRGGGYDRERGGGAPDDGPWRRGPPQRPGGGGFDDRRGGFDDRRGGHDGRRGGFDDRRGGFDDRRGGGGYGDPPAPAAERPRLQLTSRTTPPPLPPMTPKEPASASQPAAPAPKPSGSRSNPFGNAQAVDTSQRDREIEAKAAASRQATLRRRDENLRSDGAQPKGPSSVDSGRAPGEGANRDSPAETVGDGRNAADSAGGRDYQEQTSPGGEDDRMDGERKPDSGDPKDFTTGNALGETKENTSDAPAVRPVGRWAALRREREGGDERYASGAGYPRRDRDDDRRGGGMGGSMEGRRRDERPFGRRDDGAYGSRMDREPVQPPAPPAGNAFAKRFGSNFDRDADRTYTRSSGMGGGGFDRRDDDRRMGMGGGGFDHRDEDRRGGMGMGGGGGFDRRDDDRRGHGGGFDRRDDARLATSRVGRDEYTDGPNRGSNATLTDSRQPPAGRDPAPERSVEHPPTVSPPSTLSKMTIREEPKEPKRSASAVEDNAATEEDKEQEPETEQKPKEEEEQEPEPQEDPAEVARASAAEAMATGKRGAELKKHVLAQEKRTTAGALLEAALENYSTPQDMKWADDDEFGAALTALSAEMVQAQVGMIYAVVTKCHKLGFPKHSDGAVVQTMFMGMYNSELCEEDAFLEWKDDVDNPAEGRMTAVTQTTPWFMWLESVEEEEEED